MCNIHIACKNIPPPPPKKNPKPNHEDKNKKRKGKLHGKEQRELGASEKSKFFCIHIRHEINNMSVNN